MESNWNGAVFRKSSRNSCCLICGEKREAKKNTKNALWKTKRYHKLKLHFSVYYCYTAVKSKKSSVKKPVSPSRKQVQNGHKENLNTIEKILKSSSGICMKHRKELFKLTSNCPHLRLIIATSDACSGATCCFTVTCIFLVLFHCSGSSYFFFPGDKSNPQHGFLPSGRDFDRQLGNGPSYSQLDSSVIPSRLRIPTRILWFRFQWVN